MNDYRYRSCLFKNTIYWTKMEEELHRYYGSVKRLLTSWRDDGPRTLKENDLYSMLYSNVEQLGIDGDERLDKNIKRLSRAIDCRKNHSCGDRQLCPVCQSHWRYGVAMALQGAVKTNPKIRLISRQESFIMPRGVFHDRGDNNTLHLMVDERINPMYELPTGSKWSPWIPWKIIDESERMAFLADPDLTTDTYMDVFWDTWNCISGSRIVMKPSLLGKFFNKWTPTLRDNYCNGIREVEDIRENNIKKGVSDYYHNTLINEFQARITRLDKIGRDCMGSVHRIMIIPSLINNATILLRLDSMFLDTRDHYQYLKESYDEFKSQKFYQSVKWPNKNYAKDTVWHPRNKVVTTCKPIPEKMLDILKIAESRFPYSCNLYPRLLVEEFPFFLNCFSGKAFTKKTGFFRDSNI